MSTRRLDILWEPWDGRGNEHLRLNIDADHAYAESELLDEQGEQPVRVRYRIRTDGAWRTRSVEVTVFDTRVSASLYRYEALSGFSVDLAVDADGVVLDYGEYWRRVEPHGQ